MLRCLVLIGLTYFLLSCAGNKQVSSQQGSSSSSTTSSIKSQTPVTDNSSPSTKMKRKLVRHPLLSAAWRREYLSDNGRKNGTHTTESGLQYSLKKAGQGRQAKIGSRVKVNYELKLASSGKAIDSSLKRGQASIFNLKDVITGWREGIALMHEGDVVTFYIPPHLGYGKRGLPPKITPNEVLIFHVELLKVLD